MRLYLFHKYFVLDARKSGQYAAQPINTGDGQNDSTQVIDLIISFVCAYGKFRPQIPPTSFALLQPLFSLSKKYHIEAYQNTRCMALPLH